MAVEKELKFHIPESSLKALRKLQIAGGKVGNRTESDLVSTYFDTGKRKLKRHGLSLRVRQDGKKHIQTVKGTNGAQFGRDEWETEITNDVPNLGKAIGTPLEQFALKKLQRKLKPIFKTFVHRITIPVRIKRSEVEVTIDRGSIVAGHRSSPVNELELELKNGRLPDLFRVANAIERKSGAELDLQSKAERGYDLAGGNEHRVAIAEEIELDNHMSVDEAFRAIARSAVRHFSGNAEAVRNSNPEGIHQMRVGLRRLRAEISLFSKLMSGANTQRIKAQLKWLTGELAPARELDVFVNENIKPATGDTLLRRGGQAIKQEFSERRDQAFARARRALNSERFRKLLIDTLQWIESRQTIITTDKTSMPIDKFAADLLHRRITKLRKDGRHLNKMSPHARHKLRIRVKKVRYAVDFFGTLFPSKREKKQLARLSGHLKKIQDALGALNDFVAHREMVVDVALRASRRHRRALAFASGVVLGREDQAVRPLMKVAAKEVRALRTF